MGQGSIDENAGKDIMEIGFSQSDKTISDRWGEAYWMMVPLGDASYRNLRNTFFRNFHRKAQKLVKDWRHVESIRRGKEKVYDILLKGREDSSIFVHSDYPFREGLYWLCFVIFLEHIY